MPLPRSRLPLLLLVIAVVGVGLIITARTADAVGWTAALGLAATGAVGLAIGVLALLMRRVIVQIRRLGRTLDTNTRSMSEAIGEHRVEFTEIIEGTRTELAGSVDRVRAAVREINGNLDHIRPTPANGSEAHHFERFPRITDRIPLPQDNGDPRPTDEPEPGDDQGPGGCEIMQVRPFAPTPRGWAASPDVQRFVALAVLERQPALLVECGSGTSSIWLGETLRRTGTGRLVALEHDERYARLTRDMVAAHGLDGIVEVRFAPLADWRPPGDDAGTAAARRWYHLDSIHDLAGIDMLFVDGPPTDASAEARYPAGPALLPLCSPSALVVLDDAQAADGRAVTERWLDDHPALRREGLSGDIDVHVFTWERGTR
ncbi:putative O-methyltransferase YrrM [Nocardiopsis mwathae]|uniref:Putative O-methyltransferase YrrM n=1 Tax=Nocardiopsis mwathae TaxID=1472723 RepID=A0A7X0D755_9ACTN|nr:class I SAM-dependent methyltransferase [Nocardiopsis mwathae]MBB6173376.1 putative O-methyltransferase YrrM [Nocardiopsis mwathae]